MITRRKFNAAVVSAPLLLRSSRMLAQVDNDLTRLGILEASTLLRQRELSPVALTRAYLQRIEQYENSINAYITVTAEAALAQAEVCAREIQSGQWRGPLHGIPIALKDNINTAGIATTAGNRILENNIPAEDAPVWQRLKDAGAILLGKLNMHEFAYGGTSSITFAGPVHNPWNTSHIPGGSSGGSAAAVAARLCCAALGTDTLASIRQPAAYCGVVGLKATHGLCSIRGIIPVSESLDHVGPFTRSVADSALMLNVMKGFDPLDPVSIDAPKAAYLESLQQSTAGLRIGLPRSPYFERLHPDIAAAMDVALTVLAQLTAGVRDVVLPEPPDFAILLAESYAWHEPLLADAANHQFYDPSTLDRILAAGKIPVEDYIRAHQQMTVVRRQIEDVFADVDILVTPTTPGMPELIEGAELAAADSAESSVRNTAPFNLYGIPTISLPCGFSADGMPIGMQLSARHMGEETLFALAQAYERATDWHLRSPSLV
jgi:aspartyl-tRNA(Asn)/glutamyl-tRNA(Gln) amidotransferase subunit A